MFPFDSFENEQRFRTAMDAVEIARHVHYSLFTFGQSDLPYLLVLSGLGEDKTVSITKGEVKITRPLIITPDNMRPEFQNFFEDDEDAGLAQFIPDRGARIVRQRRPLTGRHDDFRSDFEDGRSRLGLNLGIDLELRD